MLASVWQLSDTSRSLYIYDSLYIVGPATAPTVALQRAPPTMRRKKQPPVTRAALWQAPVQERRLRMRRLATVCTQSGALASARTGSARTKKCPFSALNCPEKPRIYRNIWLFEKVHIFSGA